ncbi:peptidoglycan DD-metalloendopeptidase family protein [Vibrio sp.]|nr:peptidoglycan DD-metalloendopeptidase family protein [Vibrio sp.]
MEKIALGRVGKASSRLLSTLLALSFLTSCSVPDDSSQRRDLPLNLPDSEQIDIILSDLEDVFDRPTLEYQIQRGDNLSSIFARLEIDYKSLNRIMSTDKDYLALDTLRPGNMLKFWVDEQGQLDKMELEFSIVEQAVYSKLDDGSFAYEAVKREGRWESYPLVGEIHGSFVRSASKLGLNIRDVAQIERLFKEKLNFRRDIRAGDRFEVVQTRQYLDDQLTGNTELQAIKIYNRGRLVSAYLHSDGQYYDHKGKGLQRAFQRLPTKRRYRLSSHFNPRRKHPVTGRVSPHNGTDWATPRGTPIVSTGDGVVSMTRNHPYAGKYVVIDHGGRFKTRYLHLSRIHVTKGQTVSRGQMIGKAGSTGRVTGPHIHYELLDRGRAVNPVKAKIPLAKSVARKEMNKFTKRKNELDRLLKEEMLAKQSSPKQSSPKRPTES